MYNNKKVNKIYNKLKYVPNRKASKNMKQKLTELKRETMTIQ